MAALSILLLVWASGTPIPWWAWLMATITAGLDFANSEIVWGFIRGLRG